MVVLHQPLAQLVPLVHQLVAAVAQPVAVLPDGSEATALVQPTFCCTCSYLSPFIPFLILINWDSPIFRGTHLIKLEKQICCGE